MKEYFEDLNRITIKTSVHSIFSRWKLLLVLAVLGFYIGSVMGWDSYSREYATSIAFSSMDSGQSSAESAGSFTNYIVKSNSYAGIVKNTQMKEAVQKAVGFPLPKDAYEEAITVVTAENSVLVTIDIVWGNYQEMQDIELAIKTYLTHFVGEQFGYGNIYWIDGYAKEIPDEAMGQMIRTALFGLIGLVGGFFLAAFINLLRGVATPYVENLEYIRYPRECTFLGVIPRRSPWRQRYRQLFRKGRNDEQEQMEKVGHSLAKVFADYDRDQTLGVVTLSRRCSYLSLVKTLIDKEKYKYVYIPDIVKNVQSGFQAEQMDGLILLLEYGRTKKSELEQFFCRPEFAKPTGVIWLEVSDYYIRHPAYDYRGGEVFTAGDE